MHTTTRIDKYLSQLGLVSRRDARKLFRSGRVLLNRYPETDHGAMVIQGDVITIDDRPDIVVQDVVTILLYKPAGYVCSEIDEGGHLSYKHLLADCVYAPMLSVAGRLDQDTTGLVLATSDGGLIHRIISPKSHREKEYHVVCRDAISESDRMQLEQGVTLDDGYRTLPAQTIQKNDTSFNLIITEGKYHQIKRMCQAINNECIALHRIRIGDWSLDALTPGQWKYL